MKLVEETRKLNALKDEARPEDVFMFHKYVEQFIERSSEKRIATWIKSNCNAINNSVVKWKESSLRGTGGIINWIRGANSHETIDCLYRKQQKRMLDGRQKERQRHRLNDTQPSVKSCFYLLNGAD